MSICSGSLHRETIGSLTYTLKRENSQVETPTYDPSQKMQENGRLHLPLEELPNFAYPLSLQEKKKQA